MKTTPEINSKDLLKILIGVAWIDGILEPQERAYIHEIAVQKDLATDPDIEALFDKPVPPEQCYEWLQAYLGKNPTNEKYQELYGYLSTLISTDGEVDAEEAELLQSICQPQTVLNTVQNHLSKIFLSSQFLSKTFLDVGSGSDVSNQGMQAFGYYARLPNLLLSQLCQVQGDSLLRDDMAKIFLDDNFAPVPRETTIKNLQVIGELPPEMVGTFLRNGPNPQFDPIGLYHWFDGDGMIHSVEIREGKAIYRNRYVQTEAFGLEQQADKAIWPGLMNLPRFDGPHGILMKNVANTALVHHGGKLLALWEAGEPYEITLPDLDTVGSYTFGDRLTTPFTAHPKVDPVTGEMMFFGCSFIIPPHLHGKGRERGSPAILIRGGNATRAALAAVMWSIGCMPLLSEFLMLLLCPQNEVLTVLQPSRFYRTVALCLKDNLPGDVNQYCCPPRKTSQLSLNISAPRPIKSTTARSTMPDRFGSRPSALWDGRSCVPR